MLRLVPLAAPSLSDRFSAIIDGLCRAVAARAAPNPAMAPLLILLWTRLRRMTGRFASLAAGQVVRRAAEGTPPRRSGDRSRSSGTQERLPRSFGWLVRLVPEAACSGAQLQGLLSEPGMAELLAAAPQAKRMLRPLCRMLAVEPGPELLPSATRERLRPKRDASENAVAGSSVRPRRRHMPRVHGLAWLRWRPVDAIG